MGQEGHRALGPEVTEDFARNGVVCLRGLLDGEWIRLLRAAIDQALLAPGPGRKSTPGSRYIVENSLWRHNESFRRFALESPIGRAAAIVMGCREARLYNDTMFVKEPGATEPTPWHQDLPYFKLAGANNCSVWIGLDPVTQASGAMSFALGSHRWGKMFRPINFGKDAGQASSEDAFDGFAPDIDATPERYPTASFDLEPGDVTFHHLLTLHSATPNSTADLRRRAHTIRFAGDGATWIDRPYSTAEFDTDLKDGEPLDGPLFPVLWPGPAAVPSSRADVHRKVNTND